jgi:hypothetical protein
MALRFWRKTGHPQLRFAMGEIWPISTVTDSHPETAAIGDKPPLRHAPDGQGIAMPRLRRPSR